MTALISLKLAYRHVRAGMGRMVLTVLAVALGVALVVAIRLMNAAVLASFLDAVDGVAGRAQLTVSAGEGLTFSEDVVAQVAAIPGVRLAVPLVRSVAFPDDGSGELLTVHGVDLGNDTAVRLYHRAESAGEVIDDLLVFLSRPDSIVLGREFAARRGLTIDSRLDLVTPTGVKPFTVRGLLDAQDLAKTLGGRLVVMDVYAAERAFTAEGQINQVDIVLDPEHDVTTVRDAIAATLPAGLTVEEPVLRKDVIRRTVGGFQAMLTAFALLAVLAGFVICYSRLGAIFEARTWEVGLLRAVGLRRVVVFRELLKESLLLGAVGTAIGVPVGLALGRFGLPVFANATALNFRLPPPTATTGLDAGAIAMGALVGLVAAILAAALPAMRLARKQPVAALTLRGRDTPPSSSWIGPLGGVGLLVAGIALAAWQQVTHIAALGNVTTGLVALSACILARPLVLAGGRVLVVQWRRLFGPAGGLAAGHLAQQARRASLTVATLGVGIGAIMMFGMLTASFERTLVGRLSGRFSADIVVSSALVSGGYRGAAINETIVHSLGELPGVALAVGNQARDIEYGDGVVVLDAYDPACFSDRRVCQWPLDAGALPGALKQIERGDAVMVSSAFAHQHVTRPGDTLRVPSPHGELKLQVAAVTAGQAENAIVINRERYREAWNDPAVYLVHLALAPGTSRADAETAIARGLGVSHRLLVRSTAELIGFFADQVREGFKFLYLMEAITFLLVLIAIGDTLATGVIERTREFGMMRAIGVRRARIFVMVVLEGVGIGVLGLLLAAGVGLLLGVFWVEVQFPAILGWSLYLHWPVAFGLTAAALTLLLCLAGSLLPSLHAARLPVSVALRDE